MPTTTKKPPITTNGKQASVVAIEKAAPPAALAVASMIEEINQAVESVEVDNRNVMLEMAGRILSATSPEQLTVGSKATHARDILDVPIEVHAVSWQPSDIEEGGYDFYAVFQGTEVRTGKAIVVTCGGATIVPAAYMLWKHPDWLPTTVVFSEGKQTRAGYHPLNLEVLGSSF